MKHLILFLLTLFLYNAILGQLTITATAISAKKPPPVSTSQETKHQDDPNQIEAFCFQPNTSDTIWVAIDGAICANFGTNSTTFPNVVVANGALNGATTSVINISPGSNYYISDDSNDSNRYYPYSVNIDANAPTSSLWAYYFIPQGSNNDSTVCRDTVTVFFWISSTPCNPNHLILIDVSSGGLNGNGFEADAGPDISSGFMMSPATQAGTWSGGLGTWSGNVYTPHPCELSSGAIIHAIWTVSDPSCKCNDVDEALLIIGGPSIPTMTEWALILLTTLLLVVGIYVINSKLT